MSQPHTAVVVVKPSIYCLMSWRDCQLPVSEVVTGDYIVIIVLHRTQVIGTSNLSQPITTLLQLNEVPLTKELAFELHFQLNWKIT